MSFDHSEIDVSVVNDTDVDVNDRDETITLRLLPDPSFEFATAEDKTAEGLILDDDLPRVTSSTNGEPAWEGPYYNSSFRRRALQPRRYRETVTAKYR